jgi:hypothetical protein
VIFVDNFPYYRLLASYKKKKKKIIFFIPKGKGKGQKIMIIMGYIMIQHPGKVALAQGEKKIQVIRLGLILVVE